MNNTAKTTFRAPDIECDGCANAIRKSLAGVAGIASVDVDVAAKTVAVTHDREETPPAAVAAALERAGFPATADAAP